MLLDNRRELEYSQEPKVGVSTETAQRTTAPETVRLLCYAAPALHTCMIHIGANHYLNTTQTRELTNQRLQQQRPGSAPHIYLHVVSRQDDPGAFAG